MNQNKTNGGEGFLSRIYKDLFLTNQEKNSIDNNLKTAEILDRKDGIFGVSENNLFNVNIKKEATIFDMQNDFKLIPQETKSAPQKPESGRFNAEFLKNLKFNQGERPENLGNRLDQIG